MAYQFGIGNVVTLLTHGCEEVGSKPGYDVLSMNMRPLISLTVKACKLRVTMTLKTSEILLT